MNSLVKFRSCRGNMGMWWTFRQLLSFLVLLLLLCAKLGLGTTLGMGKVGCIDGERQALLQFKRELVDDYGILSSWGDQQDRRDCCQWRGVSCSNLSGHVISLHLPAPPIDEEGFDYQCLKGQISPSVLQLEQLTHLDLSYNDFEGRPIPPFLGSLRTLQHLNLSSANFGQTVPAQLGNLSNLLSLDLSSNFDVKFRKLEWLSRLSSLRLLDLSSVYLGAAIHWSWSINKLPSLVHLNLRHCSLPPFTIGSIVHANSSSSLVFVDLSHNHGIKSSIFPWLFNLSSNLIHLDLSGNDLDGLIPDSLWNMTSLTYLDLSSNRLQGSIPDSVGNMVSLEMLDLSWNQLQGGIPDAIGELSSLTTLRLSHNQLTALPRTTGRRLVQVDISRNLLNGSILNTFRNAVSLEELRLSSNHLQGEIPKSLPRSLVSLDLSSNQLQGTIPDSVGNRAISLEKLRLSYNHLQGEIPRSLPRSLVTLHLSSNQLQGSIPDTLGNLVSLRSLSLSMNQLQGRIPKSFSNLCNLRVLDLDSNNLTGQIPQGFLACANSTLRTLSLSYNQLNGTLHQSIGQLARLEWLDIGSNSFQGAISDVHFLNVSNLYYLDLSYNSLTFNVSMEWWVPPFRLHFLLLASCNVGPSFPSWLQNQNKLYALDLSNSNISDALPDWFWNITYNIDFFKISNNKIRGRLLPDLSSKFAFYAEIDISSNCFEGSIPQLPFEVSRVDFSNNKLSEFTSSSCPVNRPFLIFLDLSNNLLTGTLPDCWSHWSNLVVLNLENNRFSGKIPNSLGALHFIQTLHLRNNSFIGELPFSLMNCRRLRFVDLGNNKLIGKIPTWIGGSFPNLTFLSLRSNNFSGSIGSELCQLKKIQILDLSSNHISGVIPRCLNNLTGMTRKGTLIISHNYSFPDVARMFRVSTFGNGSFVDYALLKWKGREFEYKNTLGLMRSIDLSCNNLVGGIPIEIADLVELVSLNLSRNNLSGSIPTTIGQLKSLDALDLSQNKLSGGIPSSLSEISGLSFLNLSYNDLSGKIPLGTQLQSFSTDSYEGNPTLCGLPLLNKCEEDKEKQESPPHNFEDDDSQENGWDMWLYISIALGFIVGFWGVCGALVLNRSWRYTYFRLLDQIKDWCWVTIAIYAIRARNLWNQ